MELTVMTKAKFDALTKRIASIEEQVTALHTCNNQLAEIAFDENKFTDALLQRCEEAAREAAKDVIDVDDIANDVANQIDLSEDIQRAIDRMDFQTGSEVNDRIEDYINDNNLMNSGEVDDAIGEYINSNYSFVESDVTDDLRSDLDELINEMDTLKETIVLEVLQLIANKLTGKDTHNANNNRDDSLQVSGTDTTSQGASMLNAPSGQ